MSNAKVVTAHLLPGACNGYCTSVDGIHANHRSTWCILLFDGWNPANQLRLVVYPIIYRVLAPSQVVQDFSHQQYKSSWCPTRYQPFGSLSHLQGCSTIPGGWPWDFWTINSIARCLDFWKKHDLDTCPMWVGGWGGAFWSRSQCPIHDILIWFLRQFWYIYI